MSKYHQAKAMAKNAYPQGISTDIKTIPPMGIDLEKWHHYRFEYV